MAFKNPFAGKTTPNPFATVPVSPSSAPTAPPPAPAPPPPAPEQSVTRTIMLEGQQQAAHVSQALGDLRTYLLHARAKVASSWDLFAGNAKTTNNGLLDALGQRIDSLAGPTLQRLTKGEITFATWSGYAKEIHAGIASVIGEISNWSVSGGASQVVAGSIEDAKKAAGEVAAAAKTTALIGLPLLALVAAAVIVVAVRR